MNILRELSENEVCRQYGFELASHLDPISALGFADDTVVIGKSANGAKELTRMAISLFKLIGLEINIRKSVAIRLNKGKLTSEELYIDENNIIRSLGSDEKIKYLGVTFQSEIVLDEGKVIGSLKSNLEKLVGCPMLRPDQKLTIMNSYIWPTLVYPLQNAPLHKLTKSFLESVDLIIRSSTKEALGLPSDTPNPMLYSSQKVKGLGIFKATWEAFIQTYNICTRLLACDDPYIPIVRDLKSEMSACLEKLEISSETLENNKNTGKTKTIRETLKSREFEKWCALASKGKGVCLFDECTPANKWIIDKKGLSSSEWLNSLKMIGNVAPVRATHGWNQDKSRCRHCSEPETLAHVLGSCHHGSLLINSRHHQIRSLIAESLKATDMKVFEEVHCIAEDGSNRRIDIIAIDEIKKEAIVVDPTVRMENSKTQPQEVDSEKKTIYEPCIPDLKMKYAVENIEVIGLLIGARGTIPQFFEDFRKRFNLPLSLRENVVLAALKGSSRILQNHLYSIPNQ